MFQELLQRQFNRTHFVDRMALYHFEQSGKYLRGRLALAEAQSEQFDFEKAKTWGLACELLHNATLIHDDIQDHDPIRRGQPSLWKKYGVAQAINAGDLLIFKAFSVCAQLNSPQLVCALAQTAEHLVYGQSDELRTLNWHDQLGYWPAYVEMAKLKTGSLFQLPALGIHLLKNNDKAQEQLTYWLDLGLCYQIFDDLRDFLGLKQKRQKQKDFSEKRVNALIAFLSRDQQNRSLIDQYLKLPASSEQHKNILSQINNKILKNQTINQLKQLSESYLETFNHQSHSNTKKIILDYLGRAINEGQNHYESAPI